MRRSCRQATTFCFEFDFLHECYLLAIGREGRSVLLRLIMRQLRGVGTIRVYGPDIFARRVGYLADWLFDRLAVLCGRGRLARGGSLLLRLIGSGKREIYPAW